MVEATMETQQKTENWGLTPACSSLKHMYIEGGPILCNHGMCWTGNQDAVQHEAYNAAVAHRGECCAMDASAARVERVISQWSS